MKREGKNKEAGCTIAVITVIVLFSLFGAGGWFVNKEYKSTQETILSEIGELPVFNSESMGKDIAKQYGFKYPPEAPSMSPEEIESKAKKEAAVIAKKKFSPQAFAAKQAAIFKKYQKAKNGENVSFILNTSGKKINGTYQGTFSDHKGRYIKVEFREYRLPDILEDFHYRFDKAIAEKKAIEKRKEFEQSFQNNKKSFFIEQKELISTNLYKNNGYTKEIDTWIPNVDILSSELQKKKDSLQKEKNKIIESNKLFGFIKVDLPEKNKK